MKVPLSWLKEYVDIDITPAELEEKLFSCGFEVEELNEVGKDITNVVVGLVLECDPIPDTHLHVCKVDAGSHGTFQICCGADNVKAGGKFPVALNGATVYATAKDHKTVEGVMTIKKGKLRGYESEGMLCSGVELGVSESMYPGAGYNGLLGSAPSGSNNTAHRSNGTVAAAGAIGSMPFAPEECIAALENYRSYPDFVGKYGLKDAYNLDENWYAEDFLGIDKGISLLMIANYESDFIWDLFMKNENVQNGMNVLGFTEKTEEQ